MSSYSYQSYIQQLERQKKQKEQTRKNIYIYVYKIGVMLGMLFSIVGSLIVAWLLKCFGFYTGVFCAFVQPLVDFQITTGFYYGAFVVIGLLCWVVTAIFSSNNK